ncbi:ribonuclease H-like domain-containing protein [Dunaliella salina]|uniref:Ribonuclease H-like domain-containing protein n=1 Tax=Dunaliella salina TaxID=3046 RepID=A0ABQ7FX34_DUNSA|nr:ribonuclease H-like domain-containing protein [Dunaliella salina]|eukprot:KAF5826920.1 ribonuclease H-like domain-containing protein [Dunaliella salina]
MLVDFTRIRSVEPRVRLLPQPRGRASILHASRLMRRISASSGPEPHIVHVDDQSSEVYTSMLSHLSSAKAIAMDCEGRPTLCLMQMYAPATERFPAAVYLVDPLADKRLLPGLKPVLEGSPLKILHDCLRDAAMLLDLTGARLQPVLDTQVAVAVFQLGGLKAIEGTATLTTAAGGWPNELGLDEMMEAFGFQHKHKAEVHTLMNSRRAQGMQTSLFCERPLSPALQEYAATNVQYLITMAERMGCLDSLLCLALSQARADMHYQVRPKKLASVKLEAAAKSIRYRIKESNSKAYKSKGDCNSHRRASKWLIELLNAFHNL